MNSILYDKLAKLLNLSKSANQNEADLALQKAVKMAAEAGIDLAIVEARGTNPAEKLEMVEEQVECGQRLPTTQNYASMLLNAHFGVRVLYNGNRFCGRRIKILGDKKDVEFAKFVNEFIQDEMQRRWEYYKRANSLSVKSKPTFLYNCWRGLNDKLTEARKAAEQEKIDSLPEQDRSAVQDRYALALVDKKKMVDNFVATSYPSLGRARHSSIGGVPNAKVASDGYSTGRSININRPLNA